MEGTGEHLLSAIPDRSSKVTVGNNTLMFCDHADSSRLWLNKLQQDDLPGKVLCNPQVVFSVSV